MAKLYAELTSDKSGHVIGKGGDTLIKTRYKVGNNEHVTIIVNSHSIVIHDDITGARMAYHPDRTK